jgi:hypothetical protein
MAAGLKAPLRKIDSTGSLGPDTGSIDGWRPRYSFADFGCLLGLLSLTLALYLPYATEAGWFLDDWTVYAEQKSQGSLWAGMNACMETIPGGRKLACLYQAGQWSAFGGHKWAYHVLPIVLLLAIVAIAYAVARRARLSKPWCLAIGGAIIFFPGADSTRLWPIATIGLYVILLQMASLMIAVRALGLPPGWRSRSLHGLSAALALIAMATYEIAVPLIAVQGILYLAIFRSRKAFNRWLVDLGLVMAFVFYRLVVAPTSDPAFMTARTTGQLVTRAGVLVEGAWHSWRYLYAPRFGLIALGCIVLAAAIVTLAVPGMRQRLIRWWVVLLAAAIAAISCSLVFLTANDTYLLQYFSTNNRLNLPGTIPYVLAFVAILGLLYELVRRWSPWAPAAPLAVFLVFAAAAKHQIAVSTEHQDAWLASWSIQKKTLPGLRSGLHDAPTTARVLGFDTPRWEQGWIPVFAQTWDFRGVIEYQTPIRPDFASPFDEDVACGARGITQLGVLVAQYSDGLRPVYFVSPARGVAVHITSKRQCEDRLTRWGPVPYWAEPISG